MKTYFKISSRLMAIVVFTVGLGFAFTAYAMTPTLTLSATGNGDNVQINVNGDPSTSVILSYVKTNAGAQVLSLGSTDGSGALTTTISSGTYLIASGSSVYVTTGGLNGTKSTSMTWPTVGTNSGNLTLSQTGITLPVGQSASVAVQNNSANTVYLSNNSNPPIANVNISGNQLTIYALSNGSSTITVCAQGTSSNATTNCASAYITVQSGSAQSLTFSMSNVTVAQGQSLPITVSGGTGTYQVLNNSNSAAIQTNISGSTVTLTANNISTTGSQTSAITVCSSDMSACGIINATVGSSSTTPLVFNPSNPNVGIGQNLSVAISGGSVSSPTFNVGSNSNPNSVQASISGNTLSLYGNNSGTATITVCSSGGSCGTVLVTVSYVSSGGALSLSQSVASVLVGQVVSITVTGGTSPYTVPASTSGYFQASINGNIVTISGIAAGSANLNVCSALGACVSLSVTVNASGAGTPVTFSQNNLSLTAGGVSAVTMTGSGGYYVSNSSNPSVASAQITGPTAVVTALASGNTNISICQSGGQCGILFVSVASSGQAVSIPVFSQINPSLSIGQTLTETISGGVGSSYYILANTNPGVVQLSLNNSQLTLSGSSSGVTTVVICASSSSCATLNVSVGSSTANQAIALSQPSLTLTQGQTANETITGNGSYYINNNSNPLVASIQISGGTAMVTAIGSGTSNISVCQGTSQCVTLAITVGSSNSLAVPTTIGVTPPATTPPAKFIFKTQLQTGDLNNDVTELQKRLTTEGVYTGPITGKFGAQTRAAVKLYQKQHGIRQTGILGPLTMAALNK